MAEIRLYGKLRRYINASKVTCGNVMTVTPQPQETLEQLLARLGIPFEAIYTIFLNSKLTIGWVFLDGTWRLWWYKTQFAGSLQGNQPRCYDRNSFVNGI